MVAFACPAGLIVNVFVELAEALLIDSYRGVFPRFVRCTGEVKTLPGLWRHAATQQAFAAAVNVGWLPDSAWLV